MLNRCDDAAEFDDNIDAQQNFDDDPSVVVFRKANKVGFFVIVTPESEDDIKVWKHSLIFIRIPRGIYIHAHWVAEIANVLECFNSSAKHWACPK